MSADAKSNKKKSPVPGPQTHRFVWLLTTLTRTHGPTKVLRGAVPSTGITPLPKRFAFRTLIPTIAPCVSYDGSLIQNLRPV